MFDATCCLAGLKVSGPTILTILTILTIFMNVIRHLSEAVPQLHHILVAGPVLAVEDSSDE